MRKILVLFFFSCLTGVVNAQNDYFRDIVLSVDTLEYSSSRHTINVKNSEYLYFQYNENDEVVLLKMIPLKNDDIKSIRHIPSGDYQVIDSLMLFNNEYYLMKVRFINITKSNYLNFRFSIVPEKGSDTVDYMVNIFPVSKTNVSLMPNTEELFIGEEKVFDLICNNPSNIVLPSDWTSGLDIDYYLSEVGGQLKLHLIPRSVGRKTLQVKLQTRKPSINGRSQYVYDLPPLSYTFFIKSSRLAFLQTDKKDIMLEENVRRNGIEIQMDNNRFLEMKKTYRIENQESAGGTLVGELFTKSQLANDKVICVLRAYNYHQQRDGYLYIKDGDASKFITNINILPQTTIYKMMIMRDGLDWTENTTIYPGETFNLRIEGVSLSKANFYIEELQELRRDSVIRNDNLVEFQFKVPMNISKKSLALFSNNQNTGRYLSLREYQRPRQFDYIFVDYGNFNRCVARLRGPEIYPKTITNIIISYNADLIDAKDKLYGKQYLDLEIRVVGSRGELIEIKEIPDVCFAPGDGSPRSMYYDRKDCVKEEVSLNSYLNNKTNELSDWVKIQITFKNKKEKMGGEGFTKVVEIIRQPYVRYDMDVSFPGLLTNTKSADGTGQTKYFGGISMAMIAQFSFYDQEKVNKFKPYRVGAGFLALNALNFNENNNAGRDVAVVLLGSLNPTRNTKLSAPLYLGFGYLLNGVKYGGTLDAATNKMINQKTQHWIWLLGPGIRVSF